MGANVDAGSMTIGSPPDSWVARHADDPVRAPWDDNLSLIRDYPSRVGYIDLRVHLKPVDPVGAAKVDAEDLPFGPALKIGAMHESPQGIPEVPTGADR